jgi:NAD(P)-dependent dehydrogenase (short-subunit alcohol dehydrogenase family)
MLNDKVIVITGAASGIGRAAAKLFAASGARLQLADWDEAGLRETTETVRSAGGIVHCMRVDVSQEEQVVALVKQSIAAYGRLDGAFNNAGVASSPNLLPDITTEEWNRVNGVNATGVFFCMKHQIRAMRTTGGGAIVNTSSANGAVAEAYSANYVASKHAAVGLTRAAAAEAAMTGVRVNVILPGFILTPMTSPYLESSEFASYRQTMLERHSIGRFGKPEEVAAVAQFLLSDDSSFVNGAALPVDGGYLAR